MHLWTKVLFNFRPMELLRVRYASARSACESGNAIEHLMPCCGRRRTSSNRSVPLTRHARIRASGRRHSSPSIKGKDRFSQAKLKAYTEFHEKCGHVNMKDVTKFKRTGKLVATNLPTSLVKDYRKNCAICLASRRRRPARPGAASADSKRKFKPWEKVHCDSTGKRKVASSRGNRYFTVFVCASTWS